MNPGYLQYVRQKIIYNSWQQTVLDIVGKTGLHICPIYLMREGFSGVPLKPPAVAGKLKIRFLDAADMPQIADLPGRDVNRKELLQRLRNGNRCLGALDGSDIAAFTWFSLDVCTFPGYRLALAENEAYLFDAYTSTRYRGSGIAPYLRYRMYEALAEMGKTRLLSYSVRFNQQALRFKLKLDARIEARGMMVELFKRYRFSTKLKPYRPIRGRFRYNTVEGVCECGRCLGASLWKRSG